MHSRERLEEKEDRGCASVPSGDGARLHGVRAPEVVQAHRLRFYEQDLVIKAVLTLHGDREGGTGSWSGWRGVSDDNGEFLHRAAPDWP